MFSLQQTTKFFWKRNVAHYQHPQHQKTIAPTDRAIEQAMGR
jgi:hypothetical protein